jgi:hypothetical protein
MIDLEPLEWHAPHRAHHPTMDPAMTRGKGARTPVPDAMRFHKHNGTHTCTQRSHTHGLFGVVGAIIIIANALI